MREACPAYWLIGHRTSTSLPGVFAPDRRAWWKVTCCSGLSWSDLIVREVVGPEANTRAGRQNPKRHDNSCSAMILRNNVSCHGFSLLSISSGHGFEQILQHPATRGNEYRSEDRYFS